MSAQGPSDLRMFAVDVVDFGTDAARTPHLVGGRCTQCRSTSFPWAARCRHCDAPLVRIGLGSTGTVYSATLVRTKPPFGLPRPYGVAYVDLDVASLRVLMLADSEEGRPLAIGRKVALAVTELGVDLQGAPCLRPIFRPVYA